MKTLPSGSRTRIQSFFPNRRNVDHKIIEPCAWLMAETWLPVNDSRESRARFLIPTERAKSRRVFFRLIRRKALALIPTTREISMCIFAINSLKKCIFVTGHNRSTCKPAISTIRCHCAIIPFYLDKKSDRKFIIMRICEMSIRLEAENTRR